MLEVSMSPNRPLRKSSWKCGGAALPPQLLDESNDCTLNLRVFMNTIIVIVPGLHQCGDNYGVDGVYGAEKSRV
jgi:hypothetical protein